MQTFSLIQTTTPQGLIHQGIFFTPTKPTKRALLWVHGLTGTFYGGVDILNAFADACEKQSLAFASVNTRGHDSITGIRKVDPSESKGYAHINGGAGYEVFTDCVDDILGSLDFLESQGIKEVILVGHSTGSNKVSYFAATQQDERVIGVVLLSAVSDKLEPSLDKNQLQQDIEMMKALKAANKGDGLVVGKTFFPLTPERFLSLYTPGPEDQFDYAEKDPKMPYVSKITKPLFVLIGDQDEYLDRTVDTYIQVFRKAVKTTVYKDHIVTGGNHGFKDKETEVADIIVSWVSSL